MMSAISILPGVVAVTLGERFGLLQTGGLPSPMGRHPLNLRQGSGAVAVHIS